MAILHDSSFDIDFGYMVYCLSLDIDARVQLLRFPYEFSMEKLSDVQSRSLSLTFRHNVAGETIIDRIVPASFLPLVPKDPTPLPTFHAPLLRGWLSEHHTSVVLELDGLSETPEDGDVDP